MHRAPPGWSLSLFGYSSGCSLHHVDPVLLQMADWILSGIWTAWSFEDQLHEKYFRFLLLLRQCYLSVEPPHYHTLLHLSLTSPHHLYHWPASCRWVQNASLPGWRLDSFLSSDFSRWSCWLQDGLVVYVCPIIILDLRSELSLRGPLLAVWVY